MEGWILGERLIQTQLGEQLRAVGHVLGIGKRGRPHRDVMAGEHRSWTVIITVCGRIRISVQCCQQRIVRLVGEGGKTGDDHRRSVEGVAAVHVLPQGRPDADQGVRSGRHEAGGPHIDLGFRGDPPEDQVHLLAGFDCGSQSDGQFPA